MPEYEVGVLITGWAKFRVRARSRHSLSDAIRTAKVQLVLYDQDNEPLGTLLPESLFEVEEEEIVVYRPELQTTYHAPREELSSVGRRSQGVL